MFNEDEKKFLKSQFLARFATSSPSGKPNVAPVGFEFDGNYFYFGSIKQEILRSTPRYRNIQKGNKRVALVIDDLVSVEPWKPRGIRVNGNADIVIRNEGEFGKGEYIRVRPTLSWSWGISKEPTKTVWK
jgi:pyridoxamine 5'-phosphate oxidase family protein